MSFLVGLLLLLGMREEECFWSFTALLKTKQLAGLYQGTLPLLHLRLYQLDRLIELRLPKLFSHFKEEFVTPLLFASEWFSTLYCYGFALPTTLRIWDLFLLTGPTFLLKTALALLVCSQQALLALQFDEMMAYFKKIGCIVRCEELIDTALSITLTEKDLEELDKEYQSPYSASWIESHAQ
eukprot:CAMPEP_0168594144 /NCGR_PEP_ID=MMETSP0420-20121227/8727_1 /TAXON_ID=498008 /ORGANISM="Pessonella sp." /LENGTH=181 /DNA_ID=CAMNT_0008630415 /DNA_START=227 /DNA_END=775 /DNA_ORIENTATION=+